MGGARDFRAGAVLLRAGERLFTAVLADARPRVRRRDGFLSRAAGQHAVLYHDEGLRARLHGAHRAFDGRAGHGLGAARPVYKPRLLDACDPDDPRRRGHPVRPAVHSGIPHLLGWQCRQPALACGAVSGGRPLPAQHLPVLHSGDLHVSAAVRLHQLLSEPASV